MRSDLRLDEAENVYRGKVRDVYKLRDGRLVMVASDRISAFDVILPRGIPHKGQVLSQVSWSMLQATREVAPNWAVAMPDPQVIVGQGCTPVKVEMVVRGYLSGHAWRQYQAGHRVLCGASMPEGLRESDAFPEPIITPSTKADEGHDEDITPQEILDRGLCTKAEWETMVKYALALFKRGSGIARKRGLILVDTKYEFGRNAAGEILLIDEIHTPDSSRYFHLNGYDERQDRGEAQRQLSKEFVRQWLIAHDFMGKEGQQVPVMDDGFVQSVTERYIELHDLITGNAFAPADTSDISARIQRNVERYLKG
ncbi:MAG: phosphoribosylaminoimidazolesuccinocarboxamide synthase [Flavobacteriales bacterium]|nr:MAG: phosphoribosylaminoimidazolesuccinocarboxamide synthase [Flavobacteriales bacterium]